MSKYQNEFNSILNRNIYFMPQNFPSLLEKKVDKKVEIINDPIVTIY